MKHIVVLTKQYHIQDFFHWWNYHKKLGYTIHVIDNDSSYDNLEDWMTDRTEGDTYEKISGWPDQWQLFDDILNENRYNFKDGEYVAFIDDDEYIWYYLDYWKMVEQYDPQFKNKYYEPLESYLDRLPAPNTGCHLMPWILMSTPEVTDTRFLPVVEHCLYRRANESAQGKVFLKYDHLFRYKFNNRASIERGHVPFVNGERESLVNGQGLSFSTYGAVDPTACLRLYHYHIKSRWDWNFKINRGSAAVDHQWYNSAIENNKNFGKYITPDFTMLETRKLMGL